ncbi:MAG: hypothetical protein Pg6B_06510 [Candidatus Azobacteroides pseudotrichonymphae]|jgi:alanine racemase|nr:alanine racemase [Bacteroidales bacterium OttesenSCG-928-I14]GMO35707.1 MAG: hypothetical protein Pg6B_06510 [Candidatus Azobacteroides pseudotrichonymphae]
MLCREKIDDYTILEINLKAIIDNFNYFRSLLKRDTKIICMVKANGYGIGSYELSKTLQNNGADILAVALADEGVYLRKKGIHLPILVMNTEKYSLNKIFQYNLHPCIYNQNILDATIVETKKQDILHYPIHLKIDTGMHRFGFNPEEIPDVAKILKNQNNVFVQSIFSHLAATADPFLDYFTNQQIKLFTYLSKQLEQLLGYQCQRHILNSAGIERFPNAQFDMVRLGIGLYGISVCTFSHTMGKDRPYGVKPVAVLKTRILQIREIKKGETVGYNRNGILDRDSFVACLPVGYADGLNRHLGNRCCQVFIGGHLCPIIGNICMDSCIIDITDITNKKIVEGDEVEIFGKHITINFLAKKLQTIPYEILTSISQRVKRVYVKI